MSDISKKSKEVEDIPLDGEPVDTLPANEDIKTDKDGKKVRAGLKKKDHDPILRVSAIVLAIACIIVIANSVYDITLADHSDPPIKYGDKVIVDYVGAYGAYYDEDGAIVFDTSLKSVGDSDVKKSYEYNPAFKQLTVEIGKGDYLEKFESSLIGHVPGDVIKVMIPNGYGEAQLYDFKGTADIKQSTVLTASEFKTLFGYDAPKADSGTVTVKEHTEYKADDKYKYTPFGFGATVTPNSDGTVTVNYSAEAGKTYVMSEDVSVKVDSVADCTAKITYEFKEDSKRDFVKVIVEDNVSVYVYPDTMKYKSTDEKTGEDLYFTITVVKYA